MRRIFAIALFLVLTACSGMKQETVAAPEQAGASIVNVVSTQIPEETATVTAAVPTVAEPTSLPNGYTMAGALSFSNANTVHIAFFLNRTDHRPVFGTAYVYFMVDGQEPVEAECQLTFHGGESWCDLPVGFKTLTVKVTDGTKENESCSMDLPSYVSPDMTKFDTSCAFP